MGRAFEYRKARKMKRWGNMAKTFTKIGKEISVAVKQGGSDPTANPRLRLLIQNAKAANMPKENVERAIKKAVSKDFADYKDMVYEGYGSHGVAILVETQTDNPTRTVANVRSAFNRYGGSLGTSGSLDFVFDQKSVFRIAKKEGINIEDLELELIDYGVDELEDEDTEIAIFGDPKEFANIQNYLESNGFEINSADFERFATSFREVAPEDREDLNKLIEKLEDDDDVNKVYNNMNILDEDEEES